MKRILFILFIALCISACSKNEITLVDDSLEVSEIQLKYQACQMQVKGNINQMLDMLLPVDSRSEETSTSPAESFVNYLSNLSAETIDSLYEIYCTPEAKLQNTVHMKRRL